MHAIDYKPIDLCDLAASLKPLVSRMLPGRTEPEDPLRVDVHVRSYDDSAPLAFAVRTAGAQAGPLPVGTVLDYYA